MWREEEVNPNTEPCECKAVERGGLAQRSSPAALSRCRRKQTEGDLASLEDERGAEDPARPIDEDCAREELWTDDFLDDLGEDAVLSGLRAGSQTQNRFFGSPREERSEVASAMADLPSPGPDGLRSGRGTGAPARGHRSADLCRGHVSAPHLGRWWLAVWLTLACVFAGRGFFSPTAPVPTELNPASLSSPAPATQKIEDIRVGQRVVAENPDPESSARTADLVVDPATWRLLRLRAEERWADGTLDVIEIETLQSPEWIEQHGAQAGAMVPPPLDLLEMGVPEDLRARVVANEPCPPIESGPGCVVLTTVNHLNPDLYELTLADEQGREETVQPTGLHKFYSEDRRQWVNTEDLREGERLRGKDGWLRLVASRRVAGVHRVYNMTVAGEHVFHVSSLGLLSHNNNACADLGTTRINTDVYPEVLGTGVVDTGVCPGLAQTPLDETILWKGPGKEAGPGVWGGGFVVPRNPAQEVVDGFDPALYPGRGPFFGVGEPGRVEAQSWADYFENGLQEIHIPTSDYDLLVRQGVIRPDPFLPHGVSIHVPPSGLPAFNDAIKKGTPNVYHPPKRK